MNVAFGIGHSAFGIDASERDLTLAAGEVHVWRAPLAGGEWADVGVLSDDERQRARQFRRDADRSAFVAARSLLRELLSRYLRTAPREIRFAYSSTNKPSVANATRPLEFSVSHAGDFAMFAFVLDAAVGIDVERVRPLDELDAVARASMSASEQTELSTADDRLRTFYRLWTRREALAKGLGDGLPALLDGSPRGVLDVDEYLASRTARSWTIESFEPAEGFVASLAVEGEAPAIRLFDAAAAARMTEIRS